ncbi:MAG: ATP-dependent RNA helicase dbp6 [Bathelium mastoideum]|nr:MAG: ATP-dependent RNA helicase dbp6 [Bathelium mastoideum]
MAALYARWVPPNPPNVVESPKIESEVPTGSHDGESLGKKRKRSKKHSQTHVDKEPKAERAQQPAHDSRHQEESHVRSNEEHASRQEHRWSRSEHEDKTKSKKRKREAENSIVSNSLNGPMQDSAGSLALPAKEVSASTDRQKHKSKKTKKSKDKSLEVAKADMSTKQDRSIQRGGSEVSKTANNSDPSMRGTRETVGSVTHQKVLANFQKTMERQARRGELDGASISKKNGDETKVELHGLEPLPQPEPTADPDFQPTFSTLPAWISNPVTVPHTERKAFSGLPLDEKTIHMLRQRGYTEALAVQSVVIPMLLGSSPLRKSDLCIAATTGSGKTLAYTLPMVETLKSRPTTNLRGLVVVPTRELVSQVSKVVEQCTTGTNLKIGTAVGTVPLATEQERLVEKGRRYDPEEYALLLDKAKQRLLYGDVDIKEDVRVLEDTVRMLPNHVPVYSSSVDILICTPGRLIDHIQTTVGFSMEDLEWLIIDEADRLLNENFQQWVDIVMSALEKPKPSASAELLAQLWLPPEKRNIQKIIVSATMTRDVSKLNSLKLWRPKMIALEGVETSNVSDDLGRISGGRGNELPATLREFAVPTGDGLAKPLYLLCLLQSDIFAEKSNDEIDDFPDQSEDDASLNSLDKDDNSSEAGQISPEPSTFAAEPYPDIVENPVPASDDSPDVSTAGSPMQTLHHRPESQEYSSDIHSVGPAKVLIFTNSNENATRLSHLVGIIHPPYASLTGVLTKSSTSSAGKTVIGAFRNGKISILIASDRASRGLDLPQLSHVINYDMPRSVTSYIHRVGRTARAGKPGSAWTLFTSTEAQWFWNALARAPELVRRYPVERRRLGAATVSAEQKQEYEEALAALQRAVYGNES